MSSLFYPHANKLKGFTIVELLVVIVVIAVLASITLVSFNGIQTRAKNVARTLEVKSWEKLFELYNAANGAYPAMPDGGYCLGSGFPTPSGGAGPQCRYWNSTTSSFVSQNGNTPLMTALQTMGKLPTGDRTPIGDWIGPYANYDTNEIRLYMILQGTSTSACPSNTTGIVWTDVVECYTTLKR